MKSEILEVILVGALIFGVIYGLIFLITWLDYLFNEPLIDIVKFRQFEWWHWITYRHWWTYLYMTDLAAFSLYIAIICGVATALLLFIYVGREWD